MKARSLESKLWSPVFDMILVTLGGIWKFSAQLDLFGRQ